MPIPKYAPQRDENEPVIVGALEGMGWTVVPVSSPGFPDLVGHKRGRTELFEVKTPGKHLNKKQRDFHDTWPGRIYILYTVEDAMDADREIFWGCPGGDG